MHIHILGICGTFMGGLALLAKEMGYRVSGSDLNTYPPMSNQLKQAGIEVFSGYKKVHIDPVPDLVIIGNSISRGNEIVEYLLNKRLNFTSGPQWLADNVLKEKKVLAVSGTHGKSTTSSMLAWILEYSDLNPGFLIGGIPKDFGISARLGKSEYFVIEADEYDTAFFDKRSKFIHYTATVLIINNIEFDHADIFSDIEDIKKQFHHYVRTIPSKGAIIRLDDDENIDDVIQRGCWTPIQGFHVQDTKSIWHTENISNDLRAFDLVYNKKNMGRISWELSGLHNISNCLAAVAASHSVGVPIKKAIKALNDFKNVKRRMEFLGNANGIDLYDDFAHHPTAIKKTLYGLRKLKKSGKIFLILDIRSNSMKMGSHAHELPDSLKIADHIFLTKSSELSWDIEKALSSIKEKISISDNAADILFNVKKSARKGDAIIVMSNGIMKGIHESLLEQLS